MQVSIRATGFVSVLGAVRAIGEAGRAVNGSIASWGSSLVYARPVEKRWRKGSGGARMFEQGVAATLPQVPAILGPAIPKGAGSVGQAKRRIRDIGIEEIQKRTPVRTGALRASVRELTRPS